MQRLNQLSGSRRPPRALCVPTGAVSRPKYEISEPNLIFLLENRFSVPQIAGMIRVSVSTVRRRMSDLVLSVRALYSDISDTELDEIVRCIHQQHPMCGNSKRIQHTVRYATTISKRSQIVKGSL